MDALEHVAPGISPEDVNMSSSSYGTVFSECKAMDKSTNLLTIPFLQQTIPLMPAALQLFISFTTTAFIQNLP